MNGKNNNKSPCGSPLAVSVGKPLPTGIMAVGTLAALVQKHANECRKQNPSMENIMNWLSSPKHTPTNRELAEDASDKRCSDAIKKAPTVTLDGNQWYDISSQYLDFEAKYLRLRGLIRHHPSLPYLVYFVFD